MLISTASFLSALLMSFENSSTLMPNFTKLSHSYFSNAWLGQWISISAMCEGSMPLKEMPSAASHRRSRADPRPFPAHPGRARALRPRRGGPGAANPLGRPLTRRCARVDVLICPGAHCSVRHVRLGRVAGGGAYRRRHVSLRTRPRLLGLPLGPPRGRTQVRRGDERRRGYACPSPPRGQGPLGHRHAGRTSAAARGGCWPPLSRRPLASAPSCSTARRCWRGRRRRWPPPGCATGANWWAGTSSRRRRLAGTPTCWRRSSTTGRMPRPWPSSARAIGRWPRCAALAHRAGRRARRRLRRGQAARRADAGPLRRPGANRRGVRGAAGSGGVPRHDRHVHAHDLERNRGRARVRPPHTTG